MAVDGILRQRTEANKARYDSPPPKKKRKQQTIKLTPQALAQLVSQAQPKKKSMTPQQNLEAKYGTYGKPRTPLQSIRFYARKKAIVKGFAGIEKFKAMQPYFSRISKIKAQQAKAGVEKQLGTYEAEQRKAKFAGVRQFFGISRNRQSVGMQLKLLRFKNKLEKAKLQNQVTALKLAKKGLLLRPALTTVPRAAPPPLYPAYATPTEMRDIDSGFNADMGYAGQLFSGESFFGDEGYYGENYWGEEMEKDQLEELGLRINSGVNPLLW